MIDKKFIKKGVKKMVQEHKTWYDRMGLSELNRKNSLTQILNQ